jgi:hypothetical protein
MDARGAVIFGAAILVFVVAGFGFAYRMATFAMTIATGEGEGFGAIAVVTYLIGMIPILFVTLWAVVTGRFRDIERPKHRLFELNDAIERGGGLRFAVEPSARGRRA